MRIVERIQKLPAGMLLVPTIIGALIHTLCPQILQIGDPTQVMFTHEGTELTIGLMLFFTGTQLSVDQLRLVAQRGLPLVLVKMGLAYGLPLAYLALFGQTGVLGISFLTFACVMTSVNATLYMGIVEPYAGPVEYALFGVYTVISMPVLPMLLLNGVDGGGVDWTGVLSLVVPFVFGFVLGNADARFRELFREGNTCVIPFIGFQFGSVINLGEAARQAPEGLAITLLFYALVALPCYLFEHYALKEAGFSAIAGTSVAGVALSIPTLIVAVSPEYQPFMATAISQLAMAMLITTFATPALASWVIKRNGVATRADVERLERAVRVQAAASGAAGERSVADAVAQGVEDAARTVEHPRD